MEPILDDNFIRINTIFDSVAHIVADITTIKNNHFTIIEIIDRKIIPINTQIKKKLVEVVNQSQIINQNTCNKNTTNMLDGKINSIEKQMEELQIAYNKLQEQHTINQELINNLQPKVGKKRKWWQIGL